MLSQMPPRKSSSTFRRSPHYLWKQKQRLALEPEVPHNLNEKMNNAIEHMKWNWYKYARNYDIRNGDGEYNRVYLGIENMPIRRKRYSTETSTATDDNSNRQKQIHVQELEQEQEQSANVDENLNQELFTKTSKFTCFLNV